MGLCIALAVLPGVATAQQLDPSVVTGAPPHVRALGSVALVGLCGGLVLALRGALVDRAVDDTMGRPTRAVFYGLGAYVFALFLGLFASTLLLQLGVGRTPLGALAVVVLLAGVALLSGLGYAVFGTLLTGLMGTRRPWQGLLVGSAISGVCWLVAPLLPALAAWVLVAAFGVGGPTRTWVHSERTVASRRGSRE
jgi:MFS family permease